ncbi:hypothetical protein PsYK624_097960 [Phanerochaete sordida]|uniref:Uncharacterized protein n=1 Tax=Phanerochaete sordida TaxID=48140 RepID=A0A9P3GEW7_9APHY|nr:hypothetical protein PsYK624_097960 [Phanerochaete sordida]
MRVPLCTAYFFLLATTIFAAPTVHESSNAVVHTDAELRKFRGRSPSPGTVDPVLAHKAHYVVNEAGSAESA